MHIYHYQGDVKGLFSVSKNVLTSRSEALDGSYQQIIFFAYVIGLSGPPTSLLLLVETFQFVRVLGE